MLRSTPPTFWFRALLDTDWRGKQVTLTHPVEAILSLDATSLHLHITAPYFDNDAPPHPPGSTPRLWEHEVVELFILGEDARYLEMEFGPHGHYLLLDLHGERQLVEQAMPCTYEAHIEGARWRGHATIDRALLPPAPSHFNLYAIHHLRAETRRRHLALAHDAAQPDFHKLSCFLPIPSKKRG